MTEPIRILEERKSEIDKYFEYIYSIKDNAGVDGEVKKILKSNVLLMLYNIIEAVVSNSIDAIRNSIHKDSATNFDGLRDEIKKQIIKDLKKNVSPDKIINDCIELSNDIIKLSFNKAYVANGNLDHDNIKEISKIYGFNVEKSDYHKTKHGKTLKDIKAKRNDLAHGIFSFAEIGKDYTFEEIGDIKDKTINYLEFITFEISEYIRTKLYIKAV